MREGVRQCRYDGLPSERKHGLVKVVRLAYEERPCKTVLALIKLVVACAMLTGRPRSMQQFLPSELEAELSNVFLRHDNLAFPYIVVYAFLLDRQISILRARP